MMKQKIEHFDKNLKEIFTLSLSFSSIIEETFDIDSSTFHVCNKIKVKLSREKYLLVLLHPGGGGRKRKFQSSLFPSHREQLLLLRRFLLL